MVPAVPAVAFQKAVDDVLRVGILEVDRGDGREFRSLRPRLSACSIGAEIAPASSLHARCALTRIGIIIGLRGEL